ncbi:hypothetical protein [Agreia bicolorata]|uniref:Uncharacterized protein n=1 Tax=Agreia bicolorata TaxID=110935 RepID=A0ABR5CBR0_9MICO|nr:hypothetical protein [Agreia bicolorata]KJC62962.1 hypothetical protein TZ00_17485 [Agreia bicolorata]
MDAIEEHRPVNRLRLLLLGGLVGAGFVVGGILLSAAPAHADGGLLDGVGDVVSGVTQPMSQIVDSAVQPVVPVVETVTSIVPEPVAEVAQPVVQPVVEDIVVPVVEAVPEAPVSEIVQPVTDLVDPVVAAVPVIGDVLGSAAGVTSPVTTVVDNAVESVTSTVVTAAPTLPGASEPIGPGIDPSVPGLDLPGSTVVPDSTVVGAGANDISSVPVDGTIAPHFRGPAASDRTIGLPTPGQAGSVSSSTPSPPGSPAPNGPSEGSPVVLPTPSGSGGQGTGGGAGSGVPAALESISGSLFAQAALTVRALASDDTLPASPTFDLGSTPD